MNNTGENVFFVLTATDEGGMRHLVTVTASHSLAVSQLSSSYTALSVLAVGETGVKDSLEVSLPRNREGCQEEGQRNMTAQDSQTSLSIYLTVGSLSLIITVICIFIILKCLWRKTKKSCKRMFLPITDSEMDCWEDDLLSKTYFI